MPSQHEQRLKFFDEYDRLAAPHIFAFTQMTTEVTSDEEYLSAMYHKMRVRKSAGKQWNPVGQKMVETVRKIQDNGILVLSVLMTTAAVSAGKPVVRGREGGFKSALCFTRTFVLRVTTGVSCLKLARHSRIGGVRRVRRLLRDEVCD